MFTRLLGLLSAVSFSMSIATAADFQRVKENISGTNSDQTIEYDALNEGAVPSAKLINSKLKSDLVEKNCGISDESNNTYEAEASLVVLTKDKYVTFNVLSEKYCGGLYPEALSYYSVFDSVTGEKIDFNKEVPVQNSSGDSVDWTARGTYQNELAAVIFNAIPADSETLDVEGCFGGLSKEETIQQIALYSPAVLAIVKNKKIVLGIDPPHVAAFCKFEVTVGFEKVAKYFAPKSKVRKWAKQK